DKPGVTGSTPVRVLTRGGLAMRAVVCCSTNVPKVVSTKCPQPAEARDSSETCVPPGRPRPTLGLASTTSSTSTDPESVELIDGCGVAGSPAQLFESGP